MSDSAIFYTLTLFFVALGIMLPFLSDFGVTESEKSVDALSDELENKNVLTGFLDIILSLVTVAFWSFNVPVLTNLLVLEPLRILYYWMFVRLLRGV